MVVRWRERARAHARLLAAPVRNLTRLVAAFAPTARVQWIRTHVRRLRQTDSSTIEEIDQLLSRAIAYLRWVILAAVFLLALAQPLIGRLGEPTWMLVLLFALYNTAITVMRRCTPWLGSFAHVAALDLLILTALYTMAATPDGPIYILFLLITICAAATNPVLWTPVYTGAVILALLLISPTLPMWAGGAPGMRDLLARLIVVAVAAGTTTMLVRRLKVEHLQARLNGDLAAREAELNRLRGVLVSSVSHDLRTPLTALRAGLGMVELSLQDRMRPDEAGILATARRNGDRLGLLIDDLLLYHQLEADALTLEVTRCDLAEVAGEAIALLRPLLEEKGQSVRLELETPLFMQGDARRLGQALLNIAANAHQHTPAGTHIDVHGVTEVEEVLITIRDDGPGIPAEELERVFHRFHRLAPSGGGSGLGLAIAESIVKRHGGRMWAQSVPNHGTAFHVALPRMPVRDIGET